MKELILYDISLSCDYRIYYIYISVVKYMYVYYTSNIKY